MTKKIILGFSPVLFLVLLAGCTPSSYPAKVAQPETFILTEKGKLLSDKKWQEVSIEVIHGNLDSCELMNITGQFLKTDLDDIIIFSKEGTFLLEEGKTKAREDSKQILEQGRWVLKEDELVLEANGTTTKYWIEEVSSSTLRLKLPVRGKDYHYILKYKAA